MIYNNICVKKGLTFALLTLAITLLPFTLKAQNQDTIPAEINRYDKLINLGYTSQQQFAISGSVSSITGEELESSPVGNLSQAMAGRLPGLFTEETYSELSHANTAFFIRGLSAARRTGPLVVIDGVLFPYGGLDMLRYYMSPGAIESISVLKDASTTAIYGSRGANGIIAINTKK